MFNFAIGVLVLAAALLSGCQSGNPGVDREDRLPNLDYLDAGRALNDDNIALAAKYYSRCAKAGHGGCMIQLSNMYHRGQHFDQDVVESMKWAKGAAATGTNYGMAGLLGTQAVASNYCRYREFGTSYSVVQQWTDQMEVELSRAQALGISNNAEVDAILNGAEKWLGFLQRSITAQTCRFH